ncbi:MAG: hypothetical protein VX330_05845, partial [Candidatus Thermoplasmatota archaeon]|nr:hypothetical protein [Candidatus Thermoplasmatota archaeon]
MDRKPGPVLIDYARDGPSEDNSEPDPASPSKIPNGGWIVLGVLFVCSMFIVHAFIKYAYNRDYEEMYSITNEMFSETPYNPHIQLEVHQHDSEYIDGFEYNVYEIKIQEDDNLHWMFIQSLFGDQDGDELQLSPQSISRASNFRLSVTYTSSDGLVTDSFSCSNFADCDEDGDGWLYDYTWGGDDVYFCNCGTFYDNSIKVALPDGDEPIEVTVFLNYHQDDFFSWLVFEAVFIVGLIAGVVFGNIIDKKNFTLTVVSLCTPL